ncbi:structural protein [Xanthomonas phage XbC2]|nr:structural protein [Xanthomonas phage XbC2]
MIHTNFEAVKSWKDIPISKLGDLLKTQGFQFVKTFSTDEHRIFVNQENTLMVVFERNVGKVYSTRNKKEVLHTFNVIADLPKLNQVKRPE